MDRHQFGQAAEDRVAQYFLDRGYTLVTRRYRGRHGEVDLIALEDETLVMVEVRARRSAALVPEESIDAAKLSRICRTAEEYVVAMGETRPWRVDIVTVSSEGLRHHEDVLRPV